MAIHSPPETEKNELFVAMAEIFSRNHVPVPKIHAYEPKRGFLLVQDFGTVEFLHIYNDPDSLGQAIDLALEGLIAVQRTRDPSIEVYTRERLIDELGIFTEWVCGEMLGCAATPLNDIADVLTSEIDSHPKVTVHRDYHSRNLLLHGEHLGIVDFQDALVGSCVYDIASLLYDCYFEHNNKHIDTWIDAYRDKIGGISLPLIEPRSKFVRAMEITAMQRMMKAIGIFCRLWFKQRKGTHLAYAMPVLGRVITIANRNEFTTLANWLEQTVGPRLQQALARLTP